MKKYVLMSLSGLFCLLAFGQSDAEMVTSTVQKSDIEGHIYFLASDELKGRAVGTPEIDIAAAYLANNLRKYGVKPAGDNGSYYQNVPLQKVMPPEKMSISMEGVTTESFLNIRVKEFDFKGKALFVGYGLESDLKGKNLKGKLVIALAGDGEKNDLRSAYMAGRKKREAIQEAGALGLIEIMAQEDALWDRYAHYFNEPKTRLKGTAQDEGFIHAFVKDIDANGLEKIKSKKELNTVCQISPQSIKQFNSRNVVGYLEGADPKLKDEFIIYSAHYDHVGIGAPNQENDSIYNGARDNAVGTVTVLSAAQNIAKYPTKRSALFILFTAEESGLLGSKYYVENPSFPLEQMVYCFNSDNGGYNDTTKTTIIGLNRTTATQHIVRAGREFGLTAIDDPAPEQGLFDRSDNVHFAAKGIPAPTYCMGFTAFDDEITKYYHQVTDNPDTIDYDYMEKFFRSYVMASRLIANDPETPFWMEGDKYYEAGVELYQGKSKDQVLD